MRKLTAMLLGFLVLSLVGGCKEKEAPAEPAGKEIAICTEEHDQLEAAISSHREVSVNQT